MIKQYFIRYQFGGGKQPKQNITVEAKSIPDAYKQARLQLPKNVIKDHCFHFFDCVVLQNNPELKTNSPEVVSIQSEAFKELMSKLDTIIKRVGITEKEPKDKWLDNQELMQFLHISKRTAQHYRDSRLIAFSQIGAKVYYRLSDIEQLLATNHKVANRIKKAE